MSGKMILDGLKELASHARGETTKVKLTTVCVSDKNEQELREQLGLTKQPPK